MIALIHGLSERPITTDDRLNGQKMMSLVYSQKLW